MALAFNKIRSTSLAPTDRLTFGRFKDCRVCDVWDDHYEYLIWASKAGYVKFDKTVISRLHERGNFAKIEEYHQNEVRPWEDDFDAFPELPF
jgi:hypothetical protein